MALLLKLLSHQWTKQFEVLWAINYTKQQVQLNITAEKSFYHQNTTLNKLLRNGVKIFNQLFLAEHCAVAKNHK